MGAVALPSQSFAKQATSIDHTQTCGIGPKHEIVTYEWSGFGGAREAQITFFNDSTDTSSSQSQLAGKSGSFTADFTASNGEIFHVEAVLLNGRGAVIHGSEQAFGPAMVDCNP